MTLTNTMIVSILFLLALATSGNAYVLARRVEQRIDHRAAYQGGYALSNPTSCPGNFSTVCGDKTDINQLCCPTGNTCHGTTVGYCCPTSQDCDAYVTAFSACADPNANMFESWAGYFCCAQGLTAVIPSTGYPFCETADVSVAYTLLATMVSQYGAAAATPPVVTGSATSTGAGIVNPTASPKPTSTSSSSSASPIPGVSIGGFIAICVAGGIVICIALSIWRWCKRKVRTSIENMDRSNAAGPSMMPAYIPTNIPIYEPAPTRPYGHGVYDPVRERHTAVSPLSPIPMTPSPAYSAIDQHEMPEGRGAYDPIVVHGMGTTGVGGAYDPIEVHGSGTTEGRGVYDPIEVHGVGITGARVEME